MLKRDDTFQKQLYPYYNMRLTRHITALIFVILLGGFSASASGDLKDILNAVGAKAGNGNNALGAIGSAINNLTASSEFELTDLKGIWKYQSPAVTFQSDNALQKIGGAAAATAIEDKIKPYYEKAGITSLVLTIDEDLTFSMKLKRGTLKGTISKDESGNLEFHFSAFGKIKLGKMSAFATKAGDTLNLTFDVSKLVSIMKTVSSVANISSLNTITSLLSSYEGIYAGFKLKLEPEASSK